MELQLPFEEVSRLDDRKETVHETYNVPAAGELGREDVGRDQQRRIRLQAGDIHDRAVSEGRGRQGERHLLVQGLRDPPAAGKTVYIYQIFIQIFRSWKWRKRGLKGWTRNRMETIKYCKARHAVKSRRETLIAVIHSNLQTVQSDSRQRLEVG